MTAPEHSDELAQAREADRLAWRTKGKSFPARLTRCHLEMAAGNHDVAARLVVQALKRFTDRWHRMHLWRLVRDVVPHLDDRQRADMAALGRGIIRDYGAPLASDATFEGTAAAIEALHDEVRDLSGLVGHVSYARSLGQLHVLEEEPGFRDYVLEFRRTARVPMHRRRLDAVLQELYGG